MAEKTSKEDGIDEYRFNHVSVMISMKDKENPDDDFQTAVIRMFDVNNPHKTTELPEEVLEIPNMEKVRLRNMCTSYYLEGNDIIINDNLEIRVTVNHKKRRVTIRNYQTSVEERESPQAEYTS